MGWCELNALIKLYACQHMCSVLTQLFFRHHMQHIHLHMCKHNSIMRTLCTVIQNNMRPVGMQFKVSCHKVCDMRQSKYLLQILLPHSRQYREQWITCRGNLMRRCQLINEFNFLAFCFFTRPVSKAGFVSKMLAEESSSFISPYLSMKHIAHQMHKS